MKKLLTLVLVCALLVSVMAGCSGKDPATTDPASPTATDPNKPSVTDPDEPVKKKQVYVFLQNRGDLSYWDGIAAGADKAKVDFADVADIYVLETTADYQAHLTAMYEAADKGADLIMTGGNFKDNFSEVAQEYPDVAMIMIGDTTVDIFDNVYGFDFETSQAAFLAGIAAADIASQGLEGTVGSRTIGFIGGQDEMLVIQEFFLGYLQGAKFYDPDTKIVYSYVGGFRDPDTARTQALAMFNDANADVIFACAGGSGNGVHSAAAEVHKYVVGVDSDQAQMYEGDKDIQSRFITSVLKLNENAVYSTLHKFLYEEGKLPFGSYEILGLEVDAVGLVEDERFNAYVSEKGKQKISEATAGIKDGSIEVIGALGKEQSEIKALIDRYTK